jgi:hypothetical protein
MEDEEAHQAHEHVHAYGARHSHGHGYAHEHEHALVAGHLHSYAPGMSGSRRVQIEQDILAKNNAFALTNLDAAVAYARRVNPTIRVIQMSATRGNGMDEWLDFLRDGVAQA